MTAILFAGPTLRAEDIRNLGVAECLPPVRQGDVFRVASRQRPRAIGIVDGVFQHAPAVWHKEILWAMANGIHVFGAASMGALRAAELSSFGMVGVGRIFEAYRSGVLEPYGREPFEDDDEVAVIHGPPETGYVALSEALVNIRATLAEAVTGGIISAATRDALVRVAKVTFYQERSYETILEQAPADVPPQELAALRNWLPGGRVNLKRQDALEMLSVMKTFLAANPAPKEVAYRFEHTTLWDNAVADLGDRQAGADDPVADEVRIDAHIGGQARRSGLWRMLALEECDRRGIGCTAAECRASSAEFRRTRGLGSATQLRQWLADNGLDHASFERLMSDETRLDKLAVAFGAAGASFVLDHVRMSGGYAALAARGKEKQRALAAIPAVPTPHQSALLQAMVWYFEDRIGREIPQDLEAYARGAGYADLTTFRRAVWREYLFSRLP